MSLFTRFFAKEPTAPPPNAWPNLCTWAALKHDQTVPSKDGPRFLSTVACGDLALPSGRLVACDPFAGLSPSDMPFVEVPWGRFPVFVTLADVSEKQDRSHIREAYASVVFSSAPEFYRKAIALAKDGQKRPELTGEDFIGFPVDAGTACFVDESVIGPCVLTTSA